MGFVKSYIQMFAYRSVTTAQWKDFLFAYFKDKVRRVRVFPLPGPLDTRLCRSPSQVDVLKEVDWDAWMFTPGMPPVKPT